MIELPCSLTPGRFDSKFGDLYDGPQPTSITLLRIIYGGPRVWSQVYEARVDSWDRPVADSQPSERFILKLYVASELSNLENADADDFDHLGANPQEAQRAMTQQETLAYSKLIGCPVTPRWYGTYQVSGHLRDPTFDSTPCAVVYSTKRRIYCRDTTRVLGWEVDG